MAERGDEEKKLLNEVLPNVAAQMRTPLSVLHASLRKMIRQGAPGADALNQSYHQLLRLAGNLSAAEMLDGKPRVYEEKNGDIVAFCRALFRRLQPLAEGQGIAFSFSCECKRYVICYHERLLERLVLNLVSNALKFTPEGGKITLALQVCKGSVLLSVTDTGCGISEDKMNTLFDRYLHSERMDPAPHGLGLGLPLCRAIAEAHGGRIFAQSQVGVGTRVTLALPDRRKELYEVRDAAFDYTGGFDHVLVELSDALSVRAYRTKKEK